MVSGYTPKLSTAGFDTSRPASERYRILGRIASGGMAEIYLARMLTSAGVEREVVLKRLMPELQQDHEFVQMFHDEARIASQMRHPNIVQIYELGELDGSLFISMELLRGVNLRDLLARVHAREQALPIPLAVRIACGALEALAYAHRFTDSNGRLLNVVHRDVSPQNIIVTYEGTVKLVDFGVAKAEGRLHQTRAGLIKGKFAYMSPEQIGGGKVDGRSDLFALAEVFYELLLRRHPFFAASDMEVLRAILDVDPPHPVSIDQQFPPELGAIFMRAMRKNPGDRYPNATAMHDALEQFLQQQRTPVTTIMLGRFVRELFMDRVEAEQRARETRDDEALIEAMTAGRAETMRQQIEARSRGSSRPRPRPELDRGDRHGNLEDEVGVIPSTTSGVRDRVIEVSRSIAAPVQDPAERGAPTFLAHSGYTDPGVRKRHFQSQVRSLFDDPADNPSVLGLGPGQGTEDVPTDLEFPARGGEDEGEMPTMLGTLSAEEMAEIRGAKEKRTNLKVDRPERSRSDDNINVGPAKASTGPVVKRSEQRVKPPTPSPSSSSPPVSKSQPQVTPRSRTVLQEELVEAGVQSDRWGLMLFVAGLGALVGAIIYAIVLYTGARDTVMRLEIRSTPPGASIIFNGADTGAKTPTEFPNIASNKEHTIELKLDGFAPHQRKILPSPELGELIVNWTFKPAEDSPPP